MKPYELFIDKNGEKELVKAIALIAFVEDHENHTITLRMFDQPEISEKWWRSGITSMYEGLDMAMADRQARMLIKKAK